MNFLISLLGFQAQRPLKYSKRQRKLHRNTGGSRSNFHVGLQCFAPRGWSDGSCFSRNESAFIMIDHHQNRMIMQHTRIQTPLGPPEMLYNFISFLDKKEDIDKTIGTCIYTGY
jgi:hypothetical protein